MNKRIFFHGTQHSAVMEQYANQQLAKIEKFLENEPTPVSIDLTFAPSKVREHHKVELLVKSPHYDLISSYEHEGVDFYDVVDRVIDTMYRLLLEKKRELVDKRKDSGDLKK